jgi:hypothetical protein
VQDGFEGIKILDLEDNVKSMKMSDASYLELGKDGKISISLHCNSLPVVRQIANVTNALAEKFFSC